MGPTLEDVVVMAIKHESVMARLGRALSDDLVVANPFLRRIATFAADFTTQYGRLPSPEDWSFWNSTLTEGMIRDGTKEALGRLYARDISGYQPEFFAEQALAQLRRGAVQVAKARMNELSIVEPEVFAVMAERIQAIGLTSEKRENRFPTFGDLHRQARDDADDGGIAEELITGLAWRGRHVLLAGREKLGKSTLVGAGAVTLTRGRRFLDGDEDDAGSSGRVGRVLWLGMDEARSEAKARLATNGAMPMNVMVLDPPDPKALLATWLTDPQQRPDLVVVDSLIEYARRTTSEMPSSGDAAAWAPVVRQLTAWAHDHDVAIVTIHHATKATGEFRDSGEIGAAVDCILTMLPPTSNDNAAVRWIRVNGRRSITRESYSYAVRLTQQEVQVPTPQGMTTVMRDRYVREHARDVVAPPSLRDRIIAHVTAHPGSTQHDVFAAVGGDQNAVHRDLKAMAQEGVIREGKQGRKLIYSPASTPSGLLAPDTKTPAGK
jgi:hypothetical protein